MWLCLSEFLLLLTSIDEPLLRIESSMHYNQEILERGNVVILYNEAVL